MQATDKAVDTFFLVGGLLMAYTTIGKIRSKSGSVDVAKACGKVPLFVFIRFLRPVQAHLNSISAVTSSFKQHIRGHKLI
jgi:hypothetical protein